MYVCAFHNILLQVNEKLPNGDFKFFGNQKTWHTSDHEDYLRLVTQLKSDHDLLELAIQITMVDYVMLQLPAPPWLADLCDTLKSPKLFCTFEKDMDLADL